MKKSEDLLKKYWSAETTLEEEKMLRETLKADLSDGPEQALFAFFEEEKKIVSNREFQKPTPQILQLKKFVFAIAASLVLLFAAVWTFQMYNPTSPDVIVDDPEVAMELTKEVFGLLNGKVEMSQQVLKENIAHFDKTLVFKN